MCRSHMHAKVFFLIGDAFERRQRAVSSKDFCAHPVSLRLLHTAVCMTVKTLHGVCSLKGILLSIHSSLLLLLHFPLDIMRDIEEALCRCVTHRAFRALGIVL